MVFYLTCTKYRLKKSINDQLLRQAVHLLQRPPQMRWRRPRNCWETPGLGAVGGAVGPSWCRKPCGDGTYPLKITRNHGKNAGEDFVFYKYSFFWHILRNCHLFIEGLDFSVWLCFLSLIVSFLNIAYVWFKVLFVASKKYVAVLRMLNSFCDFVGTVRSACSDHVLNIF